MKTGFADLFTRLGLDRLRRKRTFPLEEPLYLELVDQARKEQLPPGELAAEIMSTGLQQRKDGSVLKACWEILSRREKQVIALTCLGYTNRQIAAKLYIGEETAKSHVTNALRKFDMHGKLAVQTALKDWDFSDWET
jgi:DNA-binding CsgD family transcriptional regulator